MFALLTVTQQSLLIQINLDQILLPFIIIKILNNEQHTKTVEKTD